MSILAPSAAHRLQLHSFCSGSWPEDADSVVLKKTSDISSGLEVTDCCLAPEIECWSTTQPQLSNAEGHEATSPMVVHRNEAERAMTIVLAMLICCRCGSEFASEPHLERR